MITNLSKLKLHRLFKKLCLEYKKHEEKESDKKDIQSHIENIRTISSKKDIKAVDLKNELKELEDKIARALTKQNTVIKFITSEEKTDKELLNKVTALDKKISDYLKHQDQRQKRIKELEEKINHVTENQKKK